eukprot:CAMPEP_0183365566 /NCGR_PEP_ID=MMETSP0164_2-20130417/85249_1 /TAXON_ID=221442 /ORGANISM="Coccolithus pelagicus ssp braarudi, Strain PLY182g" /LENGTH=67 /DNA_ID=CAMNT_0025541123 /DNA_START=184 /DNA_END=383 /DNA_ORIENTATION=+
MGAIPVMVPSCPVPGVDGRRVRSGGCTCACRRASLRAGVATWRTSTSWLVADLGRTAASAGLANKLG